MDTTTIQIGMGCKQVGMKKHSTEYAKECYQIKSKVTGNSRGKLGFITVTQKVTIKSKINIKARSLWWLANVQSQMFISLSQLMAMALSRWSIDANFRVLERPKMMEDLLVLKIVMMGQKFPPLTQN